MSVFCTYKLHCAQLFDWVFLRSSMVGSQSRYRNHKLNKWVHIFTYICIYLSYIHMCIVHVFKHAHVCMYYTQTYYAHIIQMLMHALIFI